MTEQPVETNEPVEVETIESLKAQLAEVKAKAVAALADSQRKVEELEREKRLNFDPRLHLFARNVKGSHSYRSKSNNSSTDNDKQRQLKELTKIAKTNANKLFTSDGQILATCIVCGKDGSNEIPIIAAHIISSALEDYSAFGVENGYKDNLDVFSTRNFMPLCGTLGAEGTCHDAIDKHLIHVRYNPFAKSYHVDCSPGAPEQFYDISKRPLNTPPGFNPYCRLLAWRSRKCGTEYGFVPDFGHFEAMNKLSEIGSSLGDNDGDNDSDAANSKPSVSTEMDSLQINDAAWSR